MRADVQTSQAYFDGTLPRPPGGYGRRLLAEGDSWFTTGTANPAASFNLLYGLELVRDTLVVNCAQPGDTLQHVVDCIDDLYFDRLLRQPNFMSYWEAVLLSGGGNDLIDAVQVPAVLPSGSAVPPDQRLLHTAAEAAAAAAGGASPALAWISETAWLRFERYVLDNLAVLVARRDSGVSQGRPLVLHTYATPSVRASGTVGRPQGWLHPAFVAAGVPLPQRQAITNELFTRLRHLLLRVDQNSGDPAALPHVHTFDSAATAGLQAATPGAPGLSGDWINEIHLSKKGFRKVGRVWGPWLEALLAQYP